MNDQEQGQATQVVEPPASPGGAVRRLREVRRATRRHHSAEDKIQTVLEGFRKELPVLELCRKAGINPASYYAWTKEFLEGGKARLQGATLRDATRDEVGTLRQENRDLREVIGELTLQVARYKKSLS